MTTDNIIQTDWSRVFIIENRAGPGNAAQYQGFWKAAGFSWSQGSTTRKRVPDPTRYGSFTTVGKIAGEQGTPDLSIIARYTLDASDLLRLVRNGCAHDLQVHFGVCEDPRDFNNGWQKIMVVEGAQPTNYSTNELGALQDSERAMVQEEVPFSGDDAYEIVRMQFGEIAASEIVQEIVKVIVCDAINCGICGLPSNGCDVVFAITLSAGGSPGLSAEVIFTQNGGGTIGDTNITTLAANEDPDGAACVSGNLIVVSQDSGSIHWAAIADILAGTETWAEVTTGFTAPTGSPRVIFSLGGSFTWIGGAGGYIYSATDPTSGVTVQTAGSVTTQPINAIHGMDTLNLVAVGDSNALLVTRDGGSVWQLVVGPAVGINLNAVFMVSDNTWWVGTANGKLYYTINGGTTWTEKTFSGSGAGTVKDIQFSTPSVGWIAHATAAPVARLLRTIDGGNTWYVAPEGDAAMVTADRFNSIAVCDQPNVVFAAGLAGNATDGVLVKGS